MLHKVLGDLGCFLVTAQPLLDYSCIFTVPNNIGIPGNRWRKEDRGINHCLLQKVLSNCHKTLEVSSHWTEFGHRNTLSCKLGWEYAVLYSGH